MRKSITYILRILLFVILTILTQVGGVIYLLSLLLADRIKYSFKLKNIITFVALYTITTLLIIPSLAPIFGRVKIQNTESIKPTNYWTVILNRNYVVPELSEFLKSVADDLKTSESSQELRYLDANFPFINKFPLLPHLSHNDGKKIDFSLVYESKNGEISNLKKSRSGYGIFAEPRSTEFNQSDYCLKNGYFQYDYPKYLTLGEINDSLVFSERGTRQLITSILKQKNLGKLFIEPHLKTRMKLTDRRIRFHGCGAVRHDDHIHMQLK
ncbi:hypothetical protein DWB61_17480 [Ancylomarina euxinus]|uniref:Uncharacterized protein n=1 Tax=Ancylomarina euxinus TaxID=2283627 RepID=A0A425XWF2_9BACT|nr:hypothetical protein [Ancylomarina euxinus]MCZ4696454.1 hypothetical protein [Ancylomarina euxinus]MUP16817.1 hypothetical protein [Ancylomarina euxinus]RRG18963.1 hypothetical protein DWB61_17480 [Ancylomarina euxinus]